MWDHIIVCTFEFQISYTLNISMHLYVSHDTWKVGPREGQQFPPISSSSWKSRYALLLSIVHVNIKMHASAENGVIVLICVSCE